MKNRAVVLKNLKTYITKINKFIYVGGLSVEDIYSLAKLANIKGEDIKIVEVGSWTGCSTYLIANEIQGRGKVFAVDHWNGNDTTVLAETAKRQDTYKIFQSNMEKMGVWDTIHPIKASSEEAVGQFEDESLDMVFIDADHRYDYIIKDLKAWLPKVKKGGILCGHDAETKYTKQTATGQYAVSLYKNYDIIPITKQKIHGGVIRALYDYFHDEHSLMKSRIWWYRR